MRKGFALLLPLAALLSACWNSDFPLIGGGDTDDPKVAGDYEQTSVGSDIPTDVRIVAKQNSAYAFTRNPSDPQSTSNWLTFDRLEGQWYIVQSQGVIAGTDELQPAGSYRIVKVTKERIEEYDPECRSTDSAFDGVSVEEDGDCKFYSFKGLHATGMARIAEHKGGDTTALTLQNTYTRK